MRPVEHIETRGRVVRNPLPGTRFPSPIEPSGYWTVPEGCVLVTLAEVTDYPIDHVVRPGCGRGGLLNPGPSMHARDRRA